MLSISYRSQWHKDRFGSAQLCHWDVAVEVWLNDHHLLLGVAQLGHHI